MAIWSGAAQRLQEGVPGCMDAPCCSMSTLSQLSSFFSLLWGAQFREVVTLCSWIVLYWRSTVITISILNPASTKCCISSSNADKCLKRDWWLFSFPLYHASQGCTLSLPFRTLFIHYGVMYLLKWSLSLNNGYSVVLEIFLLCCIALHYIHQISLITWQVQVRLYYRAGRCPGLSRVSAAKDFVRMCTGAI